MAEAESTLASSRTTETGTKAEPDPWDDASRERGRVRWFDPGKGYGFLAHPNGPDVFVHHSEVRDSVTSLEPGGEVEYEVGRNDRGLVARGAHARARLLTTRAPLQRTMVKFRPIQNPPVGPTALRQANRVVVRLTLRGSYISSLIAPSPDLRSLAQVSYGKAF
ncbi:MAG: cold-shock protein [Rubrobacteraceae bacterium]